MLIGGGVRRRRKKRRAISTWGHEKSTQAERQREQTRREARDEKGKRDKRQNSDWQTYLKGCP